MLFRKSVHLTELAAIAALLAIRPAGLQAAVARNLGADVSHHQAASGISQASWNQMYAEGKRFAFIKATEGLTGPDDAAMANNVASASAAGILVGVYHYCHPENRTNVTGAVQEADHFLSYAGSAIGPGRLRPALDLEGSSSSLTVAGLTDWVIAFSDRIQEQRGAGAAPIIYTGRSFAKNELDSRLAKYDLWLAYPTNVDATISDPPATASYPDPTGVFNNWCFWQHSWRGISGGINPLDLDVCHDEYRPLSHYLIPTPAPVVTRGISVIGNNVSINFTNVTGTHFTILAATNLAQPLNSWTVLGTAVESPAGNFHFTDLALTANPQRFYRVCSP